MISCKSGITIRTSTESIRAAGRNTQGVKLIRLDENDEIAAITKLDKIEADQEDNLDGEIEGEKTEAEQSPTNEGDNPESGAEGENSTTESES
ncbi:MAG: hypothetical protein MUE99_04080 [Chitinophagaceae bacterium]|nr:hypothetical protein [Chitinophagaceae bacterium]